MADDPMGAVNPEEDWRRRCAATKAAVEALLQKQQRQEALAEALRDPPYAPTTAEPTEGFRQVQDQAAQVVLKALATFKEADVRGAVEKLGEEEQSALMKYLYRFWGSAQPPRTNAQLFVWHAALVEYAGEGSICRAIFDWKWP
uniref:Actin-related protein 2/3 complex subunit 5 n=1 Tax=Alexandrium catenella TaxID=2925 RepID=A0A7S1QK88_ALECA|mmetsp:Transcript_33852/g.91625  ORF Transcript_33852/g.91625 Transcript_33852/m.91625 type:complete len:144 (+) Transcript_33852:96-527(+)